MTEPCERVDRHDHDDPRLPAWFHAWLRGERKTAPPMHSWKGRQTVDVPFGTVSGRQWSDAQRDAHDKVRDRRDEAVA